MEILGSAEAIVIDSFVASFLARNPQIDVRFDGDLAKVLAHVLFDFSCIVPDLVPLLAVENDSDRRQPTLQELLDAERLPVD
jgi:hypothetical protein